MIKRYNNMSFLKAHYIVLGLALQIGGQGAMANGSEGLGYLLLLIGSTLLITGLAYYAKSKGRHPAWCLMVFLSIIGLIVLAYLKDYAVEEKQDKASGSD